MDKISNNIYSYFVEHFRELPIDKQLHFASRLYLWKGDKTSRELLDILGNQLEFDQDKEALVRSLYQGELFPIPKGSPGSTPLRAEYFARYPDLRRISFTLYWAHLLDALYNLDLREVVLHVMPGLELAALEASLMQDSAALAMLSTYAVNFLYLYHEYVLGRTYADPKAMLHLAQTPGAHDLADQAQRQLHVYLLTHCIVNASGFYRHSIPDVYRPVYGQILQQAEQVIASSYDNLRLDNKFEFLVCCRLLGYETKLEQRILGEAVASMSLAGTFLVDKHGRKAASFDKSEHRNVLYIMATTAPRLTLQPL